MLVIVAAQPDVAWLSDDPLPRRGRLGDLLIRGLS
jgi:hypothetical protein